MCKYLPVIIHNDKTDLQARILMAHYPLYTDIPIQTISENIH